MNSSAVEFLLSGLEITTLDATAQPGCGEEDDDGQQHPQNARLGATDVGCRSRLTGDIVTQGVTGSHGNGAR